MTLLLIFNIDMTMVNATPDLIEPMLNDLEIERYIVLPIDHYLHLDHMYLPSPDRKS